MDTSVALVQAYLHVNGYFTVAEYPVLEVFAGEHARTVTDLDILAFRFPGAGHEIIHGAARRPLGGRPFAPDPVLGGPADRADMIVGEVKESAARFNDATRDPGVLGVALARFGCCPPEHVEALTRRLLRRGRAVTPMGHVVRMVAFGDTPDPKRQGAWATVPIAHVVAFLREYLRAHWPVLRHAQLRDPVLGVLALLEKWNERGTAEQEEVERPSDGRAQS